MTGLDDVRGLGSDVGLVIGLEVDTGPKLAAVLKVDVGIEVDVVVVVVVVVVDVVEVADSPN